MLKHSNERPSAHKLYTYTQTMRKLFKPLYIPTTFLRNCLWILINHPRVGDNAYFSTWEKDELNYIKEILFEGMPQNFFGVSRGTIRSCWIALKELWQSKKGKHLEDFFLFNEGSLEGPWGYMHLVRNIEGKLEDSWILSTSIDHLDKPSRSSCRSLKAF